MSMSNGDMAKIAAVMVDPYTKLRGDVMMGLYSKEVAVGGSDLYYGMDIGKMADEMLSVLKDIKRMGRLPVVNFAAGGVSTPADAAMMMKMGMDGVFVGSGIFKSPDPIKMAKAMVDAVENFEDYRLVGNVSSNLPSMEGIDVTELPREQRLAERGI